MSARALQAKVLRPGLRATVFALGLLVPQITSAQDAPPAPAPAASASAAPADGFPETIVAGLSQNRVAIKADFSGSEIMIYGAVRRAAPPPGDQPLHVIVTIEGPPAKLTIRRKEHVAGIWINGAAVTLDRAPSFYAVASTGPLGLILTRDEDLRYRVSLPASLRGATSSSGSGSGAEAGRAARTQEFINALLRIYESGGRYRLSEDIVRFSEATLFRTDVLLPANVTEGDYRVRIFLVRSGKVIDTLERLIGVRKEGFERYVYNMAQHHRLIYALAAILIALFAGWAASEIFRRLRL
jgi:uncharacterized protein (TIGR02186 family)